MGFIEFIRSIFSISRLPQILSEAGRRMIDGGNSAVETGRAIGGGPGHSVNASQVVGSIASIIDTAHTSIDEAAAKVKEAADLINSVEVPTIEFTTTTILDVRVVTGITITKVKPFASFHDRLETTATNLSNTSQKMHNASTNLQSLSEALRTTGRYLEELGGYMRQGGEKLQEFAT